MTVISTNIFIILLEVSEFYETKQKKIEDLTELQSLNSITQKSIGIINIPSYIPSRTNNKEKSRLEYGMLDSKDISMDKSMLLKFEDLGVKQNLKLNSEADASPEKGGMTSSVIVFHNKQKLLIVKKY